MNKYRFAPLALAMCAAGCSGLNVQWAATASYNTPQVRTEAILSPGAAEKPQAAASAPVQAASAPVAAASAAK